VVLGRRAALGVPALGDLLDDFRGEGFKVAGRIASARSIN
jgi:hypothetical protein